MSLLSLINARNHKNIKIHSGVIIYLRTVKISGKTGDLNQSVGMQGMCRSLQRENCGGIAGKNFTVDADQSFWLALARIMYSVSLTKLGECDKDSNFAVLGEV